MNVDYSCKNCKYNGNIEICNACRVSIVQDIAPTNFVPKNFLSDTNDPVNHPSHYQTKSGLETFDVIDAFTDDLKGAECVCTANVIKYICRWKKKNGVEDLKKAQWYLNKLIEKVEEKEKN